MPSADITAVTIQVGEQIVLLVSAYVAYLHRKEQNRQELQNQLGAIQEAQTQVQQQRPNKIQMIIAGDFNRHDTTWGGDTANQDRAGEGEQILDFMM